MFEQMIVNTKKNFKEILQTPGFQMFPQIKKVIIVSAGPSVKHFINSYRGKGPETLICVSRIARTLIQNGIVPDAIAHVDFQEKYFSFIEDLDLDDIELIIGDSVPTGFFDKQCKRRWLYRNSLNPIMNEFVRKHPEIGVVPCVESAGSISCDLVQLMIMNGCRSIMIAGQDCSLVNGVHYPDPKNDSYEPPKEQLLKILGQNNDWLPTTLAYLKYAERLQLIGKMVRSVNPDIKLINFSPGGAKIEGWDDKTS